MRKNTELIFMIASSILLVIIFPLNMQITESPYGIFLLLSYVYCIIFWISPMIYFYKSEKGGYKNYAILVILNLILVPIFLYNAEKEAKANRIATKERLIKMNNYK